MAERNLTNDTLWVVPRGERGRRGMESERWRDRKKLLGGEGDRTCLRYGKTRVGIH